MARPKKNNMDYFSHDNGMRNDRKIKAVRARFGLQGYAVYNMILELLAEADCLIIEWNDTEKELIAGDFGITAETLTEMVDYFISIDLINRQNGWLYSKTFDERSELLFNKRTNDLFSLRSENGINLSETPISETKTPENGSLSGINTHSKVKYSKVNNNTQEGVDWKKDFSAYQNQVREAWKEVVKDKDWLQKQQRLNPRVNILLTLEKACNNFWILEEGWEHKKKKKRDKINWRSTFANSLTQAFNREYLPK